MDYRVSAIIIIVILSALSAIGYFLTKVPDEVLEDGSAKKIVNFNKKFNIPDIILNTFVAFMCIKSYPDITTLLFFLFSCIYFKSMFKSIIMLIAAIKNNNELKIKNT